MGWLERLRPASFRGRSFFVDRSAVDVGRRYGIHEYPQKDSVFAEDLGKKARTYSFDAYVLGDDYDVQLEELRSACERRPLGYPYRAGSTLVHPALGLRRVICTGCATEETVERLRYGRLRLSFLEVEDQPQPAAIANPTGKAAAAGAALALEAASNATEELDVLAVPAAVTESMADDLAGLGKVMATLDVFTGPAKDAAALSFKITGLIVQASTLATSPLELVGAVQDAISGISSATENALGALYAYEAILADFSATSISEPISTIQALQSSNGALLESVAHSSALSGAVSSAAAVTWPSLEDALEQRSTLLDFLDARMELAADKEYTSLEALRSALVAAVPPPGKDLPSIQERTLSSSIPALVLSYQLYGRADRADDIASRNRIAHPSFLPVGTPLELISDVRNV